MTSEVASTDPPPPSRALSWARFLGALVVVSLGAAAFAAAFRGLLSLVFRRALHATDVVSAFEHLPWALRLALPPLGGALAGLVALATVRAAQGHGVGDVMEAVVFGRSRLSLRVTLLKSLGSWFAIVTGGSIGREGPLIQFGGVLGDTVSEALRLDERRSRTLMAAGTAAGFAAAYNTPLAAVLFVLEVVTGIAALDTVLATIAATAFATAATRFVVGGGPIYGARAFEMVGTAALAAYAALGLVAALVAQWFMRMLAGGEALFTRSRLPQQ